MALSIPEIKMRLGYGAQSVIARQTNRTAGHVHEVFHGRRRDRIVEAVMARKLRMPVAEVREALHGRRVA